MLPLTAYLEELHAKFLGDASGEVASYIPELARVDPDRFGICIVMVDGTVYEVGDTRLRFTIQSMSKPLTYAMALDELGPDIVGQRIGLEPTGDAFNAISLDPVTGQATNAMVNAGAITAADLIHAAHGDDAVARLLEGYSKFAGRPLSIDTDVCDIGADHGPSQPGDRASPARRRLARRRRRVIARGVLPAVLRRSGLSRSRRDRGDVGQRWSQPGRRIGGRVAADRPPRAVGDVELWHVRRSRPLDGVGRPAGEERRERWCLRRPARTVRHRRVLAAARRPGQQRSRRQGVPGVRVRLSLHLVNSGRRLGNRQPTIRTLADGGSNRRRNDDALRRLADSGRTGAGDPSPRRDPVRRRRVRGAPPRRSARRRRRCRPRT